MLTSSDAVLARGMNCLCNFNKNIRKSCRTHFCFPVRHRHFTFAKYLLLPISIIFNS